MNKLIQFNMINVRLILFQAHIAQFLFLSCGKIHCRMQRHLFFFLERVCVDRVYLQKKFMSIFLKQYDSVLRLASFNVIFCLMSVRQSFCLCVNPIRQSTYNRFRADKFKIKLSKLSIIQIFIHFMWIRWFYFQNNIDIQLFANNNRNL